MANVAHNNPDMVAAMARFIMIRFFIGLKREGETIVWFQRPAFKRIRHD